MNKRYKIEGTHLLYRLAKILFKVNLQTIAQFLKQNSAQLNIDWRGCNPQPRMPMDSIKIQCYCHYDNNFYCLIKNIQCFVWSYCIFNMFVKTFVLLHLGFGLWNKVRLDVEFFKREILHLLLLGFPGVSHSEIYTCLYIYR
jgi:hypothetical protein